MLPSVKKQLRQLSNIYAIISSAPLLGAKYSALKRTVAVVAVCAAAVCVPQLIPTQPAPSDAQAMNLSDLASLVSNVASTATQSGTLHRVTGADLPICAQYRVCGTDLGIPYRLENGSVGYLFGDTFETAQPGGPGWRSNVMLRSTTVPSATNPIVFDSAAGTAGGYAPEIIPSAHDTSKRGEYTVIPTDGISFPETGDQIISYMSVRTWDSALADWETNSSGIAWSNDGNTYHRIGPVWENNASNTDPNQMMSMARGDDQFVYIISVRAGRQNTPMLLHRVPWDQMFNKNLYECWDGYGWGHANCEPLMTGVIGEPSLRKLSDGTWAMAYLNLQKGAIVTRFATQPTGPWSPEKIQITGLQLPNLYGGFIHPDSTTNNLTLMVSTWTNNRYDVSQLSGGTLTAGRATRQ